MNRSQYDVVFKCTYPENEMEDFLREQIKETQEDVAMPDDVRFVFTIFCIKKFQI